MRIFYFKVEESDKPESGWTIKSVEKETLHEFLEFCESLANVLGKQVVGYAFPILTLN